MSSILISSIFFISSFISLYAPAGGFISNGGDYLKTQNNPWFLGPESIAYCIDSNEDYPLSKTELETLVHESLLAWKDFFLKYKIPQTSNGSAFHKGVFKDKKARSISIEYDYYSSCSNLPPQHIVFLFGKTNSVVRKAVEQRSNLSVGLSLREDYNHDTYKNNGYLWIKNFSTNPLKVKHILLHELGHVFGLKHNSVFVMDERVADRMESEAQLNNGPWGQIESPTWLYDFIKNQQEIHFTWNQGGVGAVPLGFATNKLIPREVRTIFDLKETDYHSLKLKYVRTPDGLNFSFFEFTIETLGQKNPKKIIFKLTPNNDIPFQDFALGLYTKWFSKDEKDLGYFEQFFDENPSRKFFLGSGSLEGKITAASLTLHKGTVLRIFLPEDNLWWEIK